MTVLVTPFFKSLQIKRFHRSHMPSVGATALSPTLPGPICPYIVHIAIYLIMFVLTVPPLRSCDAGLGWPLVILANTVPNINKPLPQGAKLKHSHNSRKRKKRNQSLKRKSQPPSMPHQPPNLTRKQVLPPNCLLLNSHAHSPSGSTLIVPPLQPPKTSPHRTHL
jgi:hypothetical protein